MLGTAGGTFGHEQFGTAPSALFRAIARLGGYMGTFRAKPPGWQPWWHKWLRLHARAAQMLNAEVLP
jgi:hypothetical protein